MNILFIGSDKTCTEIAIRLAIRETTISLKKVLSDPSEIEVDLPVANIHHIFVATHLLWVRDDWLDFHIPVTAYTFLGDGDGDLAQEHNLPLIGPFKTVKQLIHMIEFLDWFDHCTEQLSFDEWFKKWRK